MNHSSSLGPKHKNKTRQNTFSCLTRDCCAVFKSSQSDLQRQSRQHYTATRIPVCFMALARIVNLTEEKKKKKKKRACSPTAGKNKMQREGGKKKKKRNKLAIPFCTCMVPAPVAMHPHPPMLVCSELELACFDVVVPPPLCTHRQSSPGSRHRRFFAWPRVQMWALGCIPRAVVGSVVVVVVVVAGLGYLRRWFTAVLDPVGLGWCGQNEPQIAVHTISWREAVLTRRGHRGRL